jgi:hypothetical protein
LWIIVGTWTRIVGLWRRIFSKRVSAVAGSGKSTVDAPAANGKKRFEPVA